MYASYRARFNVKHRLTFLFATILYNGHIKLYYDMSKLVN